MTEMTNETPTERFEVRLTKSAGASGVKATMTPYQGDSKTKAMKEYEAYAKGLGFGWDIELLENGECVQASHRLAAG